MVSRSFGGWLTYASILSSGLLIQSQIAIAQKSDPQTEAKGSAEPAGTDPSNEGFFVSDGTPLEIEDLGIQVTPPQGWEVITNAPSLSVILQEKRRDRPDYKNTSFQRNITIAAMHQSSPIDEKRAAQIKKSMTETFSKDAYVSNFQILEHKFFDYKAKNDGMIVYSSLHIKDYPMMQMHILVSGSNKQFLMTYTDLAERFSSPANFDLAWNTMTSLEVTGLAPQRYEQYLKYGGTAGGALLAICAFWLMFRRRRKTDYIAEVDALERDMGDDDLSHSMISTLHGQWQVDPRIENDGDDDLLFSDAYALPKTKRTTFVG